MQLRRQSMFAIMACICLFGSEIPGILGGEFWTICNSNYRFRGGGSRCADHWSSAPPIQAPPRIEPPPWSLSGARWVPSRPCLPLGVPSRRRGVADRCPKSKPNRTRDTWVVMLVVERQTAGHYGRARDNYTGITGDIHGSRQVGHDSPPLHERR